jgi:Na+-transporting NADH:ubiquinone oxidoreductase subunit NqrC
MFDFRKRRTKRLFWAIIGIILILAMVASIVVSGLSGI